MIATTLLLLAMLAPAGAEEPCDPSLAGLELARCEVAATIGTPLCDATDARLQAAADIGLARTGELLGAAQGPIPPRRVRKLLRRADRILGRITRRAVRLERRDQISTQCLLAVDMRIAGLRDLVAAAGTLPPAALPGLPEFVAGYRSWLRLNAAPIPPRPGGDAHFGTKDVFVNQTRDMLAPAGTQRFPYPEGTIVVKESTRPGADIVSLVAIMRKRAGSDPPHGDWTFTEYTRGDASARFTLVARDNVCFGCHTIAAAMDWVYTPLE